MILAIIVCTIIAVSGCTINGWGSGNVINETKDVKGVKQVSLEGIGTIIIQQGDQESLRIEAEDNIMPHIQSKVEDEKLSISYDTNTPTPTKDVKYYLTVKDINSIRITGAGKIQSNNITTKNLSIIIDGAGNGDLSGLNLDKLNINIAGAGKILIAGKVIEQTVVIAGAGNYEAKDLESENAIITINGAGKGTVNVSKVLSAIINGAGNLDYLGNPQINQQISGGGTVQKIS